MLATSSWDAISCWVIAPAMPPTFSSAFCTASRSSLSRLVGDRLEELPDLGRDGAERGTPVADDLAEEEVLALDGGRALVEGVDLGVADVLLERVVLQVA